LRDTVPPSASEAGVTASVPRAAQAAPDVSSNLAGVSVLVVGINFAPETTGIAPYTTALVDALQSAGMRVRVVTGIPHYPAWKVSDERFQHGSRWREEIAGVPVVRVRHHVPGGASLAGRLRMEAEFMARAARVVRADDSDLVICVTPSLAAAAAVLAGRRGRPFGVVVQDLTGAAVVQTGSGGKFVSGLVGLVERTALRRATAVGVITPRFRDAVGQLGVAPLRVHDTTNFTHVTGVDASVTEAQERLVWRRDRAAVVHTGNMGRKQGLETVLRAGEIAQERDLPVQFYLVGDGNVRAELEAACTTDRVTFLPPVDNDTYPWVLAAADVLILCEKPGVVEMSMPSKLTSYVSAGRPVVASVEPDGITAEQLRRFSAAKETPAGDADALVEGVTATLADDRLAGTLVSGAERMREELYGRAAAYGRYRAFAAGVLAGQPERGRGPA
jgi:colanic acid biosynthesis glycosyl transferase WcaI